jgi:predicted membrane protein
MTSEPGHAAMRTDTRLNLTPQFVIGVFLIVFGALLTLDRMQVLSAGHTLRYWPVALIALGTWVVVERRGTQRTLPGYAMIVIGALLLLDALGVVRVRFWELFWPMIIVLVGARLIMHTPGQRRTRHEGASAPAGDGTISMFSILGSDQRTSSDKAFRGGDVTTIVGGTQLDLRRASIEPGSEAVINVFVFMGGHDLWVPPGWTVSIEAMPILAGVEDKRLPPVLEDAARVASAPAPRLVIRGVILLGGLNLKN